MKIQIVSSEDLMRLVEWYNRGDISAEEYYDAMDEYASVMIRKEIEQRRNT